jgi:hypothetical protein
MGVSFAMQAVRPDGKGGVTPLAGSEPFRARSSTLYEFLEPIECRKNVRSPLRSLFPWYDKAHDYSGPPTPADCFRPKEVLESLQGIERELSRNSARYPATWLFWITTAADGKRSHRELTAIYRGRNCRLFSDEQGVWAMETDPGPRQGVHHDLKEAATVAAQLVPGGPDVTIALERVSLLTQHQKTLTEMKAICIRALQEGALVLTQMG